MKQLAHREVENIKHDKNIIIVADQLSAMSNLGMLFRACDAFGVNNIIISPRILEMNTRKLKRFSRSTNESIKYTVSEDVESQIKLLKREGFKIISLEYCDQSVPIYEARLSNLDTICLILGNENLGVPQQYLDISDHVVHIPMYGLNTSMNVIQATSIALYEIIRSH